MRRILTKLLFFVCIVSTTSMVFGQKYQGNYDVLLKSGTRTFTSNVEDFISSPDLTAEEAKGNTFYRFLQFEEVPNDAQLEQIANTGIRLLQYIPHKTYIAAIPTNMNFQQLLNVKVRAIMKIGVNDKLGQYLSSEVYPNWAVEGNELSITVKLYEARNRKQLLSAVLGLGAKVISVHYRDNIILLKINKDSKAVEAIADLHFVHYVETIAEPGKPEDIDGRSLQRSNMLNETRANGLKFDGSGIGIQVRDNGPITPHIDFQGRVQNIGNLGTGTHGAGVGGVWASAGNLDPFAEGGATGSDIFVTPYVANFLDTTYGLHLYHNVKVTNSSYSNGCNAGYTTVTQTVDNQIWNSKTLMHVFSAGNSNNTNCGYGAGDQWGNITGGHKMGKNVIATANLFSDGSLVGSSSRGPANDGRLKPDMAAYGQGQISTVQGHQYQSFGGTSSAAPSGAGVYTMLLHAYKEMNGGTEPESGLLKATVMNTATDLGNVGPDFRFGWGLYNGRRAYNLLKDNRYITGSVAQGANTSHSFTIPANVAEARVMVYWMEPGAATSAAIALVNDLDMTVTDGATTTLPLVLDETPNAITLNNPAVPGVDDLNNVEQVRLTNPSAGTYTVNVTGSVAPFGAVNYYVLYEYIYDDIKVTYPNGGEGLDPSGDSRIHWDAHGDSGNFSIEYSTDGGTTWNLINSSIDGADRLFDWNVPSSITDNALVRVTRGSISDISDTTFTIIGTPRNITFGAVCPDSMIIFWDPVPGATSYDAMLLGTKYMDSVTNNTNTFARIPITGPLSEQWVSVRARFNDGVGTRAIAVQPTGAIFNCTDQHELSLNLVSPLGQVGCADVVEVKISSTGLTTQSNFTVAYQLDNNPIVTETVPFSIVAGQSKNYTFSTPLGASSGLHNLVAWVDLPNDANLSNDTSTGTFEIMPSFLQLPPFSDNFEAYGNCGTTSNCGGEICPLGIGWRNSTNGVADDIDWRVDEGGTPSNNTGPNVDHNPGTASGHYLYLEASGGCTGEVAELISPCIDLANYLDANLSVWYHMFGTDVGELHVDVLSNGIWTNDIVPPLTGNQGNQWQELTANLVSYAGSVVNIRIRGITGNDWSSDIAIDDFSILGVSQAPTSDFTSNKTTICSGGTVNFTDQSITFPTAWQWSFTPNTVTYMNGTSASSQHPIVQFNALGTYDVQLIASNGVGSDTMTKVTYVNVSAGIPTPVTNDFEMTYPGTDWSVENPDNLNTWIQTTGITGANGMTTSAAFIDNFNYNAPGQEDYLVMPVMDLTGLTSVALKFDVAYARYSVGFSDGMRVEASTDCGASWTIIYDEDGADLATVPDQTQQWFPSAAGDWREEEIDLTAFINNTLIIRFVNENGYGNSLLIDNVNLYDPFSTAPTADFTNSDPACHDNVTFTSNSIGALNYSWDFGPNATPQTANTVGPHTVAFSDAGAQNVSLTVSNNVGSDVASYSVSLDSLPNASFTYTVNNEVINFSGIATGATSYLWDFGDGTSSTNAFPGQKIYAASGLYTVSLTVTNDCGTSTYSTVIDVIVTNVNDLTKAWNVKVFPNPNNGQFTVELDGVYGDVELSIIDVAGKQIRTWNYSGVDTGWRQSMNVSELAKGIYILRVQSDDGVKNLKLAIE